MKTESKSVQESLNKLFTRLKADPELEKVRIEFSEKCNNLSICIAEAIKLYCKKFTDTNDGMIEAGVMCSVLGYFACKSYVTGKFTEKEFLKDMSIMFREIQRGSDK